MQFHRPSACAGRIGRLSGRDAARRRAAVPAIRASQSPGVSAATTGLASSRVSEVSPGRSRDGVRKNEHELRRALAATRSEVPAMRACGESSKGSTRCVSSKAHGFRSTLRWGEHPHRARDSPATNRAALLCVLVARVSRREVREAERRECAADSERRMLLGPRFNERSQADGRSDVQRHQTRWFRSLIGKENSAPGQARC